MPKRKFCANSNNGNNPFGIGADDKSDKQNDSISSNMQNGSAQSNDSSSLDDEGNFDFSAVIDAVFSTNGNGSNNSNSNNSGNDSSCNGNGAGTDDDDDQNDSGMNGGSKGIKVMINSLKKSSMIASDNDFDPMSVLINYNEKYANAEKCLFRDGVIWQTLAVLISKNKPNALLVGPAGVGKTKIVEEIARMIANNDRIIPEMLQNSVIYELPLSAVVSGSGIAGELEYKLEKIIEFLTDPDNKAIVFIDEIHMLYSRDPMYSKIGQIIKPALARGSLKTIGSTTTQESSCLNEDPAFSRRFTRLKVDELTKEQTVEILNASRSGFSKHYGNASVPKDILPVIVRLADQYKTAGSHRPDNALTLLDCTLAEAAINRSIALKEGRVSEGAIIQIGEAQIRETAIRQLTGLSKKVTPDFDALKDALSAIKGQDEAIKEVMRMIKKRYSPYFNETKPLTMLFAGYSGTGKTETAKILAKELMDLKPIIINMTEYRSAADINKLTGSPAGYIGSDSNRELPFDSLETNPYQLIVLDEFEKCDQAVQTLFMSAFDEGEIKKANGRSIDFSKAIIIATTNAAHGSMESRKTGLLPQSEAQKKSDDLNSLSKAFPVELLNRFQSIIEYRMISRNDFEQILADCYGKEAARLKQDFSNDCIQNLPDEIDSGVLSDLCDTYFVPKAGARSAKQAVMDYIDCLINDFTD